MILFAVTTLFTSSGVALAQVDAVGKIDDQNCVGSLHE